jgi:SSS family solute:Na+ symporter
VTVLDWAVLGLYVLVVVLVGAASARRQKDTETYFLGDRQIPWLAAGLSIVATSFSAASILGVPGYAFAGDLWYLQLQLGDVLAAVVVCALFIPFFHRLKLTSAYEYLEARFDLKTRLLGSGLFMLTVLARAGTLLYGAALLFAEVAPTDLFAGLGPVEEAVVAFGVIAIAYTVAGGITAVVWTDVLQFCVMAGGILASVALVVKGLPGGVGEALEVAGEAGKLQVLHFDADAPGAKRGVLTAVFGYGLLALSLFGTNQQPVQRYMTVKDAGAARKALLLGVGSGAVGVSLSLLFGVFLFVHYQANPGVLPGGTLPDQVVPFFIRTEVPPVLTGLLVAAVFAAAMSSLDSALNSLSAAFVTDVFVRVLRREAGDRAKLRAARLVVVIAGAVAIWVGIEASRERMHLVDLILKLMGYFSGGVLGLFLLGMLSRRATGTGAFVGALVGTAAVLVLSKKPPLGIPELHGAMGLDPIPFLWYTAVATPTTLLVGWLVSLLTAKPSPGKLAHSLRGPGPGSAA